MQIADLIGAQPAGAAFFRADLHMGHWHEHPKGNSKGKFHDGVVAVPPNDADQVETSFAEVVGLIEQARQRAYQAVNSELVGLYWRIGEYISAKLAAAV